MKAMNHIHYCKNLPFNIGEVEDFLSKFDKAITFYSQPFHPLLIAKYFEGWKVSTKIGGTKADCNRENSENCKHRIIFNPHNRAFCLGYWENMESYSIEREPKTIDEFITRCYTNGIELIFSQQAKSDLGL